MGIVKTTPLVAVAMASLVSAQDVVSVFFPGADQQPLIGSVINSDASATTLAVVCATDVPSDECGFPDPVTVTAGPSTFHAEASFESVTAIIDCALTGTEAANCAETYIGPEAYIESDLDLTATDINTAITTTSTSIALSGTDLSYFSVTLTDELPVAAATGASGTLNSASSTRTGSSSDSSTSVESTSGSSSRTSSGSGTAATGAASETSASGNTAGRSADIQALAFTAVGAGLLGLTAFLL